LTKSFKPENRVLLRLNEFNTPPELEKAPVFAARSKVDILFLSGAISERLQLRGNRPVLRTKSDSIPSNFSETAPEFLEAVDSHFFTVAGENSIAIFPVLKPRQAFWRQPVMCQAVNLSHELIVLGPPRIFSRFEASEAGNNRSRK
jgi:hypothetical protein